MMSMPSFLPRLLLMPVLLPRFQLPSLPRVLLVPSLRRLLPVPSLARLLLVPLLPRLLPVTINCLSTGSRMVSAPIKQVCSCPGGFGVDSFIQAAHLAQAAQAGQGTSQVYMHDA